MWRYTIRGVLLAAVLLFVQPAAGADATPPAKPPAAPTKLPREQPYQQVLYQFMAGLKEADFEHKVTEKLHVPPANPDPEYQYRTFIMGLIQQPMVGGKRGIPAINAPALNFLISTIEGEQAVIVPPVWAESLASFLAWDSPGNVYRDNRGLKMRAFVTAAVRLMMIDDFLEKNAGGGLARSDWNGYHLISAASPYPVFKEQLPAAVQQAYEQGLLSLARKIVATGPRGDLCEYELSPAVGLWYIAKVTGDAQMMAEAEKYARTLCSDPRYYHRAGYWVDRGGVDVGFGGIANYLAVWLALASDWPFVQEAVASAYQLRAHLSLPEPDGSFTGPSAFNSRIGSPACNDQWDWYGAREHTAAMVTDHAVQWLAMPSAEELASAMAKRVQLYEDQLYGNLRNAPYVHPTGERYLKGDPKTGRYFEDHELRGSPWAWRLFTNGFNYPVGLNPACEFYKPESLAHLRELQKQNSPLLRSPFLRPENFLRNFEGAFIVAKNPQFAAILQVGPVGVDWPTDNQEPFPSPPGLGGGQLAAFWTPSAGSVILNRRIGMSNTKLRDELEQWRTWPIHAISGQTSEGKFFTSARIQKPDVAAQIQGPSGVIKVSGDIPAQIVGQAGGLKGRLQYARTFTLSADGVQVESSVQGDAADTASELYETIPILLDHAEPAKDRPAVEATIEYEAAGKWTLVEVSPVANVKSVRVTRRSGALLITFATPQRVRLSPQVWKDNFLSRATCRNLMIDLLPGDGAAPWRGEARSVSYSITPLAQTPAVQP